MLEPKRITEYDLKPVPDSEDEILVVSAFEDEERRSPISGVKSAVLGSATIGGNSAGDILTTNAAQTVTNKRLNTPAINSASAMNATSTELNILSGATISTTELNRLAGGRGSVQTQNDGLVAGTLDITSRTFTYGTGTLTAVETQTISEATLRLPAGGSSFHRVDPNSLAVCVWQIKSGQWVMLTPADPNPIVTFTTTTAG